MPAWVHVASIVFCSHIYFRFLQSLCRKHFLRVSKTLVGGGSPALSMVIGERIPPSLCCLQSRLCLHSGQISGNFWHGRLEWQRICRLCWVYDRCLCKQVNSKNVIGEGHSLILVWIKGDESWGQAQLDLQCVWQGSGRIHWLLRDPSRSDQVEIILPHLTLFYQDIYCGQRTITKSTLIPMSKKIFNQNS